MDQDTQENAKNKGAVQEEVDLRFLYRKVNGFISRIGNAIKNIFTHIFYIIVRRWALLLVFTILGAGAGYGYFYKKRPVYVSTLVLSSKTLNNDICNDMINTLDVLIRDRTPKLLANYLKIDTSTAKAIKELEFDNYNEKIKERTDNKDTVIFGLPFKIKAYVYDYTVFDTLQTVLVNYLENNEYALKRKKITIENIHKLREKLNAEIEDVDSLKFVIADNSIPRGTQSGFVFGQPIDPLNMFREGIHLFKEDLVLSTNLELIDNIDVIEGFTARIKPDSPKLLMSLAGGAGAAFLMGFAIAVFLESRKRLKAG